MTFEEFDKYQEELLKEVVGMRDTKGKEYAHSEDRFANFNRLAEGLDLPNITVAWVYAKKHVDSIESFVKEGKTFSTEGIRGRLVDLIVYLTLIGGMIEQRKGGMGDYQGESFILPAPVNNALAWLESRKTREVLAPTVEDNTKDDGTDIPF